MIRFLRRVFGRHGPSIYANEAVGDEQFDPETQEMILSSFDLLERLVERGEKLEGDRIVNHFFAGDRKDVERAATYFRGMGYLTDSPEPHMLHVVENSKLSHRWVEDTIPKMCRLAGEFALNYDGWDCGAEIGPDQQLITRN